MAYHWEQTRHKKREVYALKNGPKAIGHIWYFGTWRWSCDSKAPRTISEWCGNGMRKSFSTRKEAEDFLIAKVVPEGEPVLLAARLNLSACLS